MAISVFNNAGLSSCLKWAFSPRHRLVDASSPSSWAPPWFTGFPSHHGRRQEPAQYPGAGGFTPLASSTYLILAFVGRSPWRSPEGINPATLSRSTPGILNAMLAGVNNSRLSGTVRPGRRRHGTQTHFVVTSS